MTLLAAAPVSTRATRRRDLKPENMSPERHGLSPSDIIAEWRTEGAVERLSTGWPTFDAASRGGFVVGRLAFLLGGPNAHKTAAAACLSWRWLHEGVAVGVLAVDEDAHDFLTRLAVMAGVSLEEAEQRAPGALARMDAALRDLPLKLYGPEWTIEAAAADLRGWMRSRGMKRGALIADSLQTITCDASLDATSLRVFVGANVAALSRAAPRHRLAVIATGEIARAHYDKSSDDMRASKESGSAEYAAKVQCVLRRTKRDPSVIRVTVPKIKRGAADETEFHLRFDRERHTLTEDRPVPGTAGTDPDLRARVLDVIGSGDLKSANDVVKAVGKNKQAVLALVKQLVSDEKVRIEGGVYRRVES